MSKELKYEPVQRLTRNKIAKALKSSDSETVASALYSAAYHDPDWRWVQDQCLNFLGSSDVGIRWAAATCLGDLAVFHKKLDLDKVLPRLLEASRDQAIRSTVQDSLDFIRHHIKVQ